MKSNLTTSFLSGLVPWEVRYFNKYQIYLGYSKEFINLGKYLYFEVQKKDEKEVELFKKLPLLTVLEDREEKYIFKVKLSKKEVLNICLPFLQGKYSNICRKFVFDNFNEKIEVEDDLGTLVEKTSLSWMILTKNVELKQRWENRLDVTFEEDYELYSVPNLSNEILEYETIPPEFKELVDEDIRNRRKAIKHFFSSRYS